MVRDDSGDKPMESCKYHRCIEFPNSLDAIGRVVGVQLSGVTRNRILHPRRYSSPAVVSGLLPAHTEEKLRPRDPQIAAQGRTALSTRRPRSARSSVKCGTMRLAFAAGGPVDFVPQLVAHFPQGDLRAVDSAASPVLGALGTASTSSLSGLAGQIFFLNRESSKEWLAAVIRPDVHPGWPRTINPYSWLPWRFLDSRKHGCHEQEKEV